MAFARTELPTGTVTFLRTDVEGSMRHARALGAQWDAINDRQLALIRDAVMAHGGIVVRTEGDAVFAAFVDAGSALRAGIHVQRGMFAAAWPPEAPLRVRVGLHSGEAHLAGDDYGGFEVSRAARIAAVGHGGQIVVSDAVRALMADALPPDVTLRDLGRHPLRDVPSPEQLYQVDIAGLPTDFPPPRTTARATGNLPARLTSFVGREKELAELETLLEGARLVTIVGPGGIGKTSLGVALGERATAMAKCADGAWFVPLDHVAEAQLVGAGIARALGLYDGPGRSPMEGVRRWFADRSAVLILDNFEHVLEAAAELPALLRSAPGLRVVVTSRAPLRVAGEQEYPLGPLAHDDADAAAVRLFEDRARAVVPGWSPGDEAPVVAEICRLLDGLPLGVELAAARVGLLPLAVIRERLTARLPLPGTGPRDLPARQRTLDGAIAWSYELLAPAWQRLLRELSVFDGGFDLEQARGVATDLPAGEDVLDGLMELADQSLVQPASGGASKSIRFRLLETIRSFCLRALQQAGEEPAVRRRHADAFLDLAEQAAPFMPGGDQARWLDRLELDHGNLTAALRWSVEQGEVRLAQRLAAATWRYFQIGGHLGEGRGLIDAVLAMPAGQEPTPERLWAVGAAGGVAYWQGETEEADRRYRHQLSIAEQIEDRAGEADATWNLAATDWIRRDMGGAEALINRARALYEAVGDERGAARTQWGQGNLMVERGLTDDAIAMALVARRRYAELGDSVYFGLAAGDLAYAYWIKGDVPQALRWGIEALRIAHALRDRATTALTLGAVGAMDFAALGRPYEAVVLVEAFERLCDVHGIRPPAGFERMLRRPGARESLHAALSPEADAAAVEQGRRMELDEAVAYAIAIAEDIVGPEGLVVDEPSPG